MPTRLWRALPRGELSERDEWCTQRERSRLGTNDEDGGVTTTNNHLVDAGTSSSAGWGWGWRARARAAPFRTAAARLLAPSRGDGRGKGDATDGSLFIVMEGRIALRRGARGQLLRHLHAGDSVGNTGLLCDHSWLYGASAADDT